MDSSDSIASRARPVRQASVHLAAVVGAALLGCILVNAPARAQREADAVPGDPPAAGATTLYSAAQLDQMLAPLALYPDDLLGQILMAATYPLEVVQANRWLHDPANASLRGSALAQALQPLPWDASVKSLVAYPQILAWLDSGLDWTEAVGDAFLAQQADVMDSVQRLRSRARDAGTLSSTPQETVTTNDQAIQITSPDSTVEYVPVYSPDVAYGPWPYPDYPPYDFAPPGYVVGTFIAQGGRGSITDRATAVGTLTGCATPGAVAAGVDVATVGTHMHGLTPVVTVGVGKTQVLAEVVTAGQRRLPRTGAPIAMYVIIAMALLAIGGGGLTLAHRLRYR